MIYINKYFLNVIKTSFQAKKDAGIPQVLINHLNLFYLSIQCIKELKQYIKTVEDFKFIISNHGQKIEEAEKKFTQYNKFSFYRSLYVYPLVLWKDLVSLDLQKSNIGMIGLIMLALFIKKTKTLTSLNISFNNIRDEGCKILSPVLQHNKSIQMLNMECNDIYDNGLKALSTGIIKSESLNNLKFVLNCITLEGIKYLIHQLEIANKKIAYINFKYNNMNVESDENKNLFKVNNIHF